MFISIVLNTEYWDYASRSKWYLKNLVHCKDNKWILITHEFLGKHFEELQKDVNERFFREFEMHPFTSDDLNEVEQYFIPDSIFDIKEKKDGSRTQTLISMTDEAFPEVEATIEDIIIKIKKKHPNETIEGIFNCLENFQFLRNISSKFNIPLIAYSFSAIRMPHGYRQTLYHTNRKGYLYTTKECQERYEQYKNEDHSDIPVFSHEEIISLIGKERTLPLIPLLNAKPKYEMGICGESFAILPQFFNRNVYTDDDIFYECNKLFPKDSIIVRSHAAQLDMIKVDRSGVHNDPAPFLLSCKRLAAVRSQIMLKALLWKRSAIVKKDTLGFSFLCNKNYESLKTVDIEGLNYYIFGYLVPSGLMFSDDYWKWRLNNPSETDIYKRHLKFLSSELNIPESILFSKNHELRLQNILENRGCDHQLIDKILQDEIPDVDYDDAISKFVLHGDNDKTFWRLNSVVGENLVAQMKVDLDNVRDVEFYPFDDVAGGCKLIKVSIDGNEIAELKDSTYRYLQKGKGCYKIPTTGLKRGFKIECMWSYRNFSNFIKDL